MTELADLILRSGRAGVEFALFVLLPVMVVMLTLMRLLEAKGMLEGIVQWVSPLLLPLGIPGLGVFALLQILLDPMFRWLELPAPMVLPIVTKYIAGGTAMMGVAADFLNDGLIAVRDLNRIAGFLINPLDVAGVAILISAGPRVASVLRPALLGGLVAILIRTLFHYFWFL